MFFINAEALGILIGLLLWMGQLQSAYADSDLRVCIPISNLPGSAERVKAARSDESSLTEDGSRARNSSADSRNSRASVFEWKRTFSGWPGVFDSSSETALRIEILRELKGEGELALGDATDVKLSFFVGKPGLTRSIEGAAVSGTIAYSTLDAADHENEVIGAIAKSMRQANGDHDGVMLRVDARIEFQGSSGSERVLAPCLLSAVLIFDKANSGHGNSKGAE